MDFTEAILLTAAQKKDARCIVGKFTDELDEPTQRQIADALNQFDKMRVFRAAQLIGYTGSYTVWARHWVGTCGCK